RLPTTRDVAVLLSEEGERPEGFEIFVIDLDEGRGLELENNRFSVQLKADGSPRRLRLIIGLESFAREHSDGYPVHPIETQLDTNYPNPFASRTTIRYQLSERTFVRLAVFDLMGREVRLLANAVQDAGYHTVEWDGNTASGAPAASGVYMYRIMVDDYDSTRKMVLVR
ncbi:MAG: T9SS type A sorting domain-containing protein, partial [Rhodothermales bacterium]|nr:T9SS type A sorting domain-containing protein [Rhodothermales bacterium]